MSNVLGILEERGFVYQTTDDSPARKHLRELLGGERVSAYIGFDPTATSLHVGSLVQIMALSHLQRAGHRPIVLLGGGTGLIGDPTGKTEMRKLLDEDTVSQNVESFRRQVGKFLDFDDDRALLVNNASWLVDLNYIDFLREIGRHFSVNRMLSHDCFKSRFEGASGLSFLEFNYMLLQSYDFLHLYREYDCRIQMGGSDQWGNIVSGVELIRRVEGEGGADPAHGLTIPLLMTSSGNKMGKTEKGAVWIDAELTSPYDYYQFWINTEDVQVGQLLRLFTYLELDRIRELEKLEGADIREAKKVLALEATTIAHGREEAEKARDAAAKLFGAEKGSAAAIDMPTHAVDEDRLAGGIPIFILCADGGLCSSRGEARRLAKNGGLYLNGERAAEERVVNCDDVQDDGTILLRAGKKRHLRVTVKG